MADTIPYHAQASPRGSLLALGFGTSVVMWATAYVGLSPLSRVPIWLLLALLSVYLVGSGYLLLRLSGGGAKRTAKLGLTLTGINFLIVASLNGRETTTGAIVDGLMWIGGFAIVSIALCCLGGLLAGRRAAAKSPEIDWTQVFSWIVALTTLPLLLSGGIVTGLEAGMAVPDWLTTFDYPMIFYPMVKMQENSSIYAEHFHRLWGLLVGLSVLTLFVHIQVTDRRAWVKGIMIVVLLSVIIQGILGGTRVTENNLMLAIVHGVFGQLVFATIVALTAITSNLWKSGSQPVIHETADTDRRLTMMLPILLILQLILGALYRHLNDGADLAKVAATSLLYLHIIMAVIVTVGVIFTAGRAWGIHAKLPVLPRIGKALLILVCLQLLLGGGAMIVVLTRSGEGEIPILEVIITTAHQTTGALLLAFSILLAVWVRRLLASPGNDESPAETQAETLPEARA